MVERSYWIASLPVAASALLVFGALCGMRAEPPPQAEQVSMASAEAPKISAAQRDELTEVQVADVVQLDEELGFAVILVAKDGTVLPVFVEPREAIAIALRLVEVQAPHPFPEDTLDDVVVQMGGRVEEARVGSIHNQVFESVVLIRQGNRLLKVPARASDTIAMALSSGAKIFASKALLDSSGITPEEMEQFQEEEPGVGGSGPKEPATRDPGKPQGAIWL